MAKQNKKLKRSIKNLIELLEGDGLRIEESDETRSGKAALADLNLQFKRRKYPITVTRKESMPTKTLEKELDEGEILLMRKNREDWKVYMDLNTLTLLLLNNRS